MKVLNSDATEMDLSRWRSLREKALTYMKRTVDDIRNAAGFIFRNDPVEMTRYPTLYFGRRSRRPSRPPDTIVNPPTTTPTPVAQPT